MEEAVSDYMEEAVYDYMEESVSDYMEEAVSESTWRRLYLTLHGGGCI